MRAAQFLFAALLALICLAASAAPLDTESLGVIFKADDAASRDLAEFYARQRSIPRENLVGVSLPNTDVIAPGSFMPARAAVLARLPTQVQSLLLVWSRPYAVGCMSVTTAFAAGYRAAFCEPGCAGTASNPLYDTDGWLPADTVGWWPAMLLPSEDEHLAHEVVARGIAADGTAPGGRVYLISTEDAHRNVRAAEYANTRLRIGSHLEIALRNTPVSGGIADAIGYFTGAQRVEELPRIGFLPGAAADHLTSSGGVLDGREQMSVLEWLRQGATGSYGTVSEPCNRLEKFPNPGVLFEHYLRGDSLLQAYWKSVAMPGQGLFVGEPLARPFAIKRRTAASVTGLQHKVGI